jgi:hypothetical protein
MSLLVWSEDRPDWQRDALRRIAVSGQITQADRDAIHVRLKHAHGITVEGDLTCTPLGTDHLPPDTDAIDPTLLCGIGPVLNVDRLAPDQQLRFGMNGITLVFGDNGTGKSGYPCIEITFHNTTLAVTATRDRILRTAAHHCRVEQNF